MAPDDDSLFESDDEAKPWNRGASTEALAAKTELARVQQERREKIDKVLSHILTIFVFRSEITSYKTTC